MSPFDRSEAWAVTPSQGSIEHHRSKPILQLPWNDVSKLPQLRSTACRLGPQRDTFGTVTPAVPHVSA